VLGASVPGILWMLGKSFITTVLVASVIAIPIAWWGMHKWLMNFEYRINMPWWVFIIAVVIALLVAIVNISFQAIKAAMMNPVKSLRTE
jgi:putative ABC transport system permease protein